jgi:hypothetical protein
MKLSFALVSLATVVSAFPVIDTSNEFALHKAAKLAARTVKIIEAENAKNAQRATHQAAKRQSLPLPNDALGISRAETNCGPTLPCPAFNAEEQFISVEGEYAYAAPAEDEIRGPCPGLNAAANHGYLPRSGVASIEETVRGLSKCGKLLSLLLTRRSS